MKDLYDENGTVESQENEDTSYLAARRIRKMKKLNLQDMSNITGLSVAYLSKYENGKANITIAALRKIAMALEVPVTALLTAEVQEKAFVVQQDKRFKIIHHESETGDAIEEFITRGLSHKMSVTVITLPPHDSTGACEVHDSEVFTYVLEGELCLVVDHEHYLAKAGDSTYHIGQYPHYWENKSDEQVKFIVVETPPSF